MKKTLLFSVFVLLVIPFIKILPQETTSSSGMIAQLHDGLANSFSYSVQGGEMSKEEEERCLKNISPELKAKLEEVKKLNKNKYYQLLRESSSLSNLNYYFTQSALSSTGKAFSAYEEVYKERNEQMKKQKELEIDAEIYALKYKNADNTNQQKIKSDLQSALNQLFDIREAQKQEEVKSMEKRLQELKESLQGRKQNKNEIVQRRMQEMLGDSKYLRWE
jgi:hypothetical protein